MLFKTVISKTQQNVVMFLLWNFEALISKVNLLDICGSIFSD